MPHLPSYLHPPGFWYANGAFTPQYLQICDIFARSKFVQIHFFVQWCCQSGFHALDSGYQVMDSRFLFQ